MQLFIPGEDGRPILGVDGTPEEIVKSLVLFHRVLNSAEQPKQEEPKPGNDLINLLLNSMINREKKEDDKNEK